METGYFSPSGARSDGHEAIADASEAHDARMAALFREAEVKIRCHVPGVLESGSGMKQGIEIEDVVVVRGRRPHGRLNLFVLQKRIIARNSRANRYRS